MENDEVTISLTKEEAQLLDVVFLPANPNRMRKAASEVVALARKIKDQIKQQAPRRR
jgi:hypothetical protein